MKIKIALVAAALLAAVSAGAADAVREVFPNGLVAIVAEDHTNPVAAIRVYVRAGSIYEGKYLGAGLSHFLEHMLGERTDKHTKAEIEAAVSELGGAYNAYTWKDHVCYYVAVRSDKVDDGIEHLEETVFHTVLEPENVENQRDIIVNEIRMGLDEPSRVLQKAFFYAMFREHPVRYPTIGYEEIFVRASREDLQDYYDRYYIPERTIVVVAGDVDADRTFGKLRETFGALPRGKSFSEEKFHEPPQLGRRDVVVPMDIGAAYMWLGFRGPELGTDDAYALEVATAIAGFGRSSRLYRRVLEEGGYVTDVEAWLSTPPTGYGYLGVYAEGEAIELNYAEDAIIDEMLRFTEDKVSKDELTRAKKLLEAQYIMGLSTVADVAEDLGENELYTGNMNYGDEYLERINEVTADDIREAARRHLKMSNLTVAKVVPRDWAAGEEVMEVVTEAEPMEKFEYPSGLRLLVRRNPAAPSVAVRGVIGGGSRVTTPGREGVAELAAELMVKGTKKRKGDRIAREMENLGGTIGSGAYLDYMTLSADCLAEDFEKAFDIYADCLTNSTMPSVEFTREQDRLLAQLQSEDDDWELHGERLMREGLFPTHPYRYRTTGTVDSVGRLTDEDAYAYYTKYVTPGNVVISVVGDVDPADVKLIVDKKLGSWNPPASPAPIVPADPPPSERTVLYEKTDNEQAVVYVGFRGVSYGDADEFALRLLDAASSGVYLPGGRLHERLRGAGYVYVVHAYNITAHDPGYFGIFAATSPGKADEVLAAIEEEIAKLKAEPITGDELELARENWLTMNALYNSQSNGDVALLSARDELVGLGFDWRQNFDARIEAVTAADILAAARKYLVNPVIVVTTPTPPGEEPAEEVLEEDTP
ncbi:MAG: pitrilysin family protein [Candidatus Zixiibacteriota bacterium]|jgi:zinc protease